MNSDAFGKVRIWRKFDRGLAALTLFNAHDTYVTVFQQHLRLEGLSSLKP